VNTRRPPGDSSRATSPSATFLSGTYCSAVDAHDPGRATVGQPDRGRVGDDEARVRDRPVDGTPRGESEPDARQVDADEYRSSFACRPQAGSPRAAGQVDQPFAGVEVQRVGDLPELFACREADVLEACRIRPVDGVMHPDRVQGWAGRPRGVDRVVAFGNKVRHRTTLARHERGGDEQPGNEAFRLCPASRPPHDALGARRNRRRRHG
jgi:hypothetical protein